MAHARHSRIVGLVLVGVLAGGAVLLLSGSAGSALGDVYTRVSLAVVDAETGGPLSGAEVFVGDDFEVNDPEWRAEAREGRFLPLGEPGPGPWRFAVTGPDGRIDVFSRTTHCRSIRRWDELFGTVPFPLESWDGISLWVSAPDRDDAHRTRIARPRTERPGAAPHGGTLVEVDAGRIALERAR